MALHTVESITRRIAPALVLLAATACARDAAQGARGPLAPLADSLRRAAHFACTDVPAGVLRNAAWQPRRICDHSAAGATFAIATDSAGVVWVVNELRDLPPAASAREFTRRSQALSARWGTATAACSPTARVLGSTWAADGYGVLLLADTSRGGLRETRSREAPQLTCAPVASAGRASRPAV